MKGWTWPGRLQGAARRLRECVRSDWRLVAQMAALRLSLPLLKRLFNVATLADFLWSPTAAFAADQRRDRIDLIKSLVRKGGRLLVSPNCLERSLMLYALLSRADADPSLVLGTRKVDAQMAGHAWVVLDGEPLFDAETIEYQPVITFGSSGRAAASNTRLPRMI